MTKRLSKNQRSILRAIGDLSERQPYPPMVREIRARGQCEWCPATCEF